MAYEFHSDNAFYLDFLSKNAKESIMPFIKGAMNYSTWEGKSVLELGCGEGGNLRPFAQAGAKCIGIDLNTKKVDLGNEIMKEYVDSGHLLLRSDNLFDPVVQAEFKGKFDLIILKDVIEHIPDKVYGMKLMSDCLADGGALYIGWPPWYMPFGGHQQICDSKLLGKLPWIHLLPRFLYKGILKVFGEPKVVVDELMELVDYRVTTNQMYRMMKEAQYKLIADRWYFINPIYQHKFGLKTREQSAFIKAIPYLRDFFTTSCYFLMSPDR